MSNGSGSNLTCRRMSGASSGWMIAASLAASCTCRRAWSAIGLLFGDGRRSGGGRPSRGLSRQTAPYEFAHLCAWTCQNSSQSCRRKTSRRHHPNPAEAHRRWRGERSEPVRLGVRDHHTRSLCAQSPAPSEQWCCWFGRHRIIFGSAESASKSCSAMQAR